MKSHRPNRSFLLSKVFGLDLRSLAALRIGLALFILYDLFSRSFDLTAHYTDAGTIPRSFLIQNFWGPAYFSVHMATGTAFGIAVIFLVHGIAAAGLLLGYRTRLMTFIVWLLLTSLQTRHPLILNAGDDLLRVILFFAIFLPLGARYSIDAALNSQKEDSQGADLYASASTAVYYLQFIAVYFFSALLKSGPEWRTEGTAIYYVLNIDQYALPLGKALLNFPELLKSLTFGVWWLELLGAFIFLIPFPMAKVLGVFLFAGLQFGFAVTLALGHFPWVNAVALLALLPGVIWDRDRDRKRKALPKTEIIYDGDCGFCRKLVLILVEFLRPRLKDAPRPAQKNEKDLAALRRENSWIVRVSKSGANFFEFEAFVQFVSSSPILFWSAPLLHLKPVRRLGTAAYRFVAGHRPFFGRLFSFLHFRPVRLQTYWWREALVIFFFIGVVIFNSASLISIPRLNYYFEFPTMVARLDQYWNMFAPSPTREDGWYVIEGRLTDGSTKVDAFREKKGISYEKPNSAADFYPNERWRKYMMNIWLKDYAKFRMPFAHYLCWNWNRKNPDLDRLEQVSIFFMLETTPPPGQPGDVKKLNLLDSYHCP